MIVAPVPVLPVHTYVNGETPVTTAVAEPLLPPKQDTFVLVIFTTGFAVTVI